MARHNGIAKFSVQSDDKAHWNSYAQCIGILSSVYEV